MRITKLALKFATGMVAFSGPVSAQMFENMAPTFANNNQIFSNMATQAQRNANRVDQPRVPITRTPNSLVTLKFVPVINRRRSNLAAFANRLRSTDPVGAAELDRLFASTDVIAAAAVPLAQYGLRTDDVSDAYAAWWINSWQAAHGDLSDASRTKAQSVKRQAANALAATPAVANMSHAMKQEMAETMIVQAMLFSDYMNRFKNDPVSMRKLADAVRKGAKASGLDLDDMTLTDEGFVPARKTGAADPAPGAPEQALAANENTIPAANNPPYLLMAAAGGAGIGGVFLLGKAMARRG